MHERRTAAVQIWRTGRRPPPTRMTFWTRQGSTHERRSAVGPLLCQSGGPAAVRRLCMTSEAFKTVLKASCTTFCAGRPDTLRP